MLYTAMSLLFDIEDQHPPNIEGLFYVPEFIKVQEECALLHAIDQKPWLSDLKRRVQHYGYKYDYNARAVTNDAYLGELRVDRADSKAFT